MVMKSHDLFKVVIRCESDGRSGDNSKVVERDTFVKTSDPLFPIQLFTQIPPQHEILAPSELPRPTLLLSIIIDGYKPPVLILKVLDLYDPPHHVNRVSYGLRKQCRNAPQAQHDGDRQLEILVLLDFTKGNVVGFEVDLLERLVEIEFEARVRKHTHYRGDHTFIQTPHAFLPVYSFYQAHHGLPLPKFL